MSPLTIALIDWCSYLPEYLGRDYLSARAFLPADEL